jgi:Na+/H+ antiporter NhaD/arsenite permease-like protein
MIIIAANSGGAWSPIGDVTTTMLWIGGQVTTVNIILKTIVPSIVVCLIPLLILARSFRGKAIPAGNVMMVEGETVEGNVVLFSSIVLLLGVPIFKLPPICLLSWVCCWPSVLCGSLPQFFTGERRRAVNLVLQVLYKNRYSFYFVFPGNTIGGVCIAIFWGA